MIWFLLWLAFCFGVLGLVCLAELAWSLFDLYPVLVRWHAWWAVQLTHHDSKH